MTPIWLPELLRYQWSVFLTNSSTYHNPIRMIALVRCNFSSNRKTLYTKVKIWAHYTLNSNPSWDIFIAIITVVQSPFPFKQSMNYTLQEIRLVVNWGLKLQSEAALKKTKAQITNNTKDQNSYKPMIIQNAAWHLRYIEIMRQRGPKTMSSTLKATTPTFPTSTQKRKLKKSMMSQNIYPHLKSC